MGVHGVDHVQQLLDLILGQAHAQHMDIVLGIGAHAIPVGDAAAQLLDDEVRQDALILPGENQRLDGDILLVHPIQHNAGEEVVHHGVNGHLRVEDNQADAVQHRVEEQGEPPHRDVAAHLAQAQAHRVQAAAAAAAGQDNAAAHAVEDASQDAGRQIIVHNRPDGDGNQAGKEGIGPGTHDGPQGQSPAQHLVGEDQNGDVGQQIQKTRNIIGAEVQMQIGLQQRPDQLAHAQGAAGVQSQRHDEKVDACGRDQFAQHGQDQPQGAVVQGVVQHR